MSPETDFVRSAVAFLSRYFDVREPKVVLNCQETCPYSGSCRYVGCYKPWSRTVSFKSGQEKGYVVSHEVGHHLDKMGIIEDGEPAAVAMEEWWGTHVSELECSVCGYPLFASEDMVGQDVKCPKCGSTFEVIPLRGKPLGSPEIVVSRTAFIASVIGVPIAATIIGSFMMDRLPKKELGREENIHRSREFVGFLMADIAISGVVTALII